MVLEACDLLAPGADGTTPYLKLARPGAERPTGSADKSGRRQPRVEAGDFQMRFARAIKLPFLAWKAESAEALWDPQIVGYLEAVGVTLNSISQRQTGCPSSGELSPPFGSPGTHAAAHAAAYQRQCPPVEWQF